MFIAIGKGSLDALKAGVKSDGTAKGPALLFDLDAARLVPVIAKTPEQKELAKTLIAAEESWTPEA